MTSSEPPSARRLVYQALGAVGGLVLGVVCGFVSDRWLGSSLGNAVFTGVIVGGVALMFALRPDQALVAWRGRGRRGPRESDE